MVKNDNKCPFCGKLTLEPFEEVGHGWLKCTNCGATDIPNPTKSARIAMLEKTWGDEYDFRHYEATPI